MIRPFINAGIDVEFYPSFEPISGLKTDAVLVLDYFGYTGHSEVKDFDGTVIRDLTHSLFSKTYADADYYFGSLRKWAGFWTGGFAWPVGAAESSCPQYIELRREAMGARADYIAGEFDSKAHLDSFKTAELLLTDCAVASAATRDAELARRLDVTAMAARRRENARTLLNAVADIALFPEIKDTDCPLFVPIRLPNEQRDALRRLLIDNEVYPPVHWPKSELHRLDEGMSRIYGEELSLVCDQRYAASDMERVCALIDGFRHSH